MLIAIVGTKHCVWEQQTKQGLKDQVILANANKDKTGGSTGLIRVLRFIITFNAFSEAAFPTLIFYKS